MLPENLIYLFVGLATVYSELEDDDPIFIPSEWFEEKLKSTSPPVNESLLDEPPRATRSIIVPLHRSQPDDSEVNPDPTAWI